MAAVPKNINPSGSPTPSGRRTVSYRHLDGSVHDAVVEAVGGGANQLNIWVPSLSKASQHKTNVARRTTLKGTGVWF